MLAREYSKYLLLIVLTGVLHSGEDRYRIGILGCLSQDAPAPALAGYVEAEPDLALWVGDNVYADTLSDPGVIAECYATLSAKPAFQELMAEVPTVATWDDHDFGYNNAGKEYPYKRESQALFREFWGMEAAIPAEQEGVYSSHVVEHNGKRIQLILLDVRYHRDPPYSGGDVLGSAQWAWLEEQLEQPADVRLVVSGFQILLDRRAGSETWAKFPEARERLFRTIRESGAQRVVFIAGDQHYGEVNRLGGALDYDAVELQFAGINQIEDPEWNPLRVANAIRSKHSIALLDLYLEGSEREVPHLHYTIRNASTGALELSYRVNLSELETRLTFEGPAFFAEEAAVAVDHPFPELEVRYTLDGSEPQAESPLLEKSLTLRNTRVIRAALFDARGNRRSRVYEKRVERLEPQAPVGLDDGEPGLRYQYYEVAVKYLDDLLQADVLEEGLLEGESWFEKVRREDHYGFVFEGFVPIPETGVYTFATYSDDGTRLFIGDHLVVDNDGSHSPRLKDGIAVLEAGYHPFRLEYFEDYAGEQLVVHRTGPDGGKVVLTPEDFRVRSTR